MRAFASVWAGNNLTPIAADYGWMYADGYGSNNLDCTTPSSSGCWGHRDAILGKYTGLFCSDCYVGAAFSEPAANGWKTSYAEIMVEPANPGIVKPWFTWAKNVVPYLSSTSSGLSDAFRAS